MLTMCFSSLSRRCIICCTADQPRVREDDRVFLVKAQTRIIQSITRDKPLMSLAPSCFEQPILRIVPVRLLSRCWIQKLLDHIFRMRSHSAGRNCFGAISPMRTLPNGQTLFITYSCSLDLVSRTRVLSNQVQTISRQE